MIDTLELKQMVYDAQTEKRNNDKRPYAILGPSDYRHQDALSIKFSKYDFILELVNGYEEWNKTLNSMAKALYQNDISVHDLPKVKDNERGS